MKKIFSLVAMATLMVAGMASCSNEDANQASVQNGNMIGFTASTNIAHSSRGFALNASNVGATLPDFQTWAYDAVDGGLYMGVSATEGRTVSNADENTDGVFENAWSYSPVQFWPVNALNFVALAPATPNGVTGNSVAQDGTSKDITLTTAVTV